MENQGSNGEMEKEKLQPEGAGSLPSKTEDAAREEVLAGKPKKKAGVIAAVAAAAAAVVAVGVFAFVKLTEEDPKEVVIAAFESVYEEGQTNPMEELFGLSGFVENAAVADIETGLTIRLDSSSDESLGDFAGSGIRVTGSYDRTNKQIGANVGLIYKDMDFLNADFYYGDEILMAKVPELSSKVFSMDISDGLGERLQASAMLGPMLDAQGIDAKGLGEYFEMLAAQGEEGGQTMDVKALMNRYKEGTKAQERFKEAMAVEKAEKGTFLVDGQEANCKGYLVFVSKDAMMEFLRSSTDFFLNDKELKDLFVKRLEQSVRMTELLGGGAGLSAQQMYDSYMEDLTDEVNQMIDVLDKSLNDVSMTVYVDKKGRLAAVNGSTVLTAEDGSQGEDVQILFDVKLQGGAYLTQNLDAQVELEYGEGQKAKAVLAKQGSYDGNRLTDDVSVDFDMEGDENVSLGFLYTDTYQADSGDYHVGASVVVDGYLAADVSMTGVVSQLEKGTSVKMDIDELKIVLTNQAAQATLSGEYFYGPLSGTVEKPEGQAFDVVAADESAWQQLAMEMMFQIIGLANQLGIQ